MIYVKDREITMITPELDYQPMPLTIKQLQTALASGDERIALALKEAEVKELEYYDTDEKIAEEIIKDFQESGWEKIEN